MRSAAFAIVRNAADLAPLTVLHHHLVGAETVWVIDNGSSDGTYELLRRLADKVPGLRVDRDDGPFDQARMATDMANALLREGHRLIVPFDSDECWDLSIPRLARFMAGRGVNAVEGMVVNYVQARSVQAPVPGSWKLAVRRVERPMDPGDLRGSMTKARHSFVQLIFPPKMLAAPPAGSQVDICKGAHEIRFDGCLMARWRRVACLHLPLRAASELEKRVNDYKARHAPFRRFARWGWRLDHWSDVLASGGIEREWAANSYGADGMLDVFGRTAPTVRDDRLVRYLRRADLFLKSMNLPGARFWALPARAILGPRFSSVKSPARLDVRPRSEPSQP
ncbi:MAG TPA: glycosyltransferase family 2 protein [Dongiaceae bacterium]|nr:glycosyltransferase family 2 protein [Dongiaceae bacterium]